jgi:phospholipid transport system substrate-binding protein
MQFPRTVPSIAKSTRVLAAAIVALCLAVLGFVAPSFAQDAANPKGNPADFVQVLGNKALNAVKQDPAAKQGDLKRINELVDQYILPYVNLDKTTRLAAAQNWRKATAQQKEQLVAAFRNTLIRTYSGALANVDKIAALNILPFRGDVNADDVVIRSTFSQHNGPSFNVDYRLERTPDGWKIYDLNVEGIWLIQNYRSQFSQQIAQSGIDGLIDALNQKNR